MERPKVRGRWGIMEGVQEEVRPVLGAAEAEGLAERGVRSREVSIRPTGVVRRGEGKRAAY